MITHKTYCVLLLISSGHGWRLTSRDVHRGDHPSEALASVLYALNPSFQARTRAATLQHSRRFFSLANPVAASPLPRCAINMQEMERKKKQKAKSVVKKSE